MHDRFRTLAVGGPQAVGAGVPAAQDHDPLALGCDALLGRHLQPAIDPVLLRQVVDCQVYALELFARDIQPTSDRRAAGQANGVVLAQQAVRGNVHADVATRAELDPLSCHQFDASIDNALFQFEVGDAKCKQAAQVLVALENRDQVPGAVQLDGGGQTGGTGPNDGDALAGPLLGRVRHHPSFVEAAVYDGLLDVFDRDGLLVDGEHAGGLAGRGAYPARELGEVVGCVQRRQRVLPAPLVHQVVPVGDEIAQWTTLVAEGKRAVHAARGLAPGLVLGPLLVDLAVVLGSLSGGPALRGLALEF